MLWLVDWAFTGGSFGNGLDREAAAVAAATAAPALEVGGSLLLDGRA